MSYTRMIHMWPKECKRGSATMPHVNEACHTSAFVLLFRSCMCSMTYSRVTWLILAHLSRSSLWRSRMCEMTQSCVITRIHMWQHAFICDMTHSPVIWLIHLWHDAFTCDLTHSYVTWLIHVWHDSFMCDMTHWCVTWPILALVLAFNTWVCRLLECVVYLSVLLNW